MTITLVQVIFIIAALALCALILLQQPKSGGGMGALSGGASSTVLGRVAQDPSCIKPHAFWQASFS